MTLGHRMRRASGDRSVLVGTPLLAASDTNASSYSGGEFATLGSNITAADYPLVITIGRAAATRSMSGLTLGGVAMTHLFVASVDSSGNDTLFNFWRGNLGQSGAAVLTYSGTMVRALAACYPVRNVLSWSLVDSLDVSMSNPSSGPIDVVAGGAIFAATFNASGLTGLTSVVSDAIESDDAAYGYYQGPTESGRVVSVTGIPSGGGQAGLGAISLR